MQRCQRVDPEAEGGQWIAPCVLLSDRSPWTPVTTPIFGDASIRKDDTRLRIFSGTANPRSPRSSFKSAMGYFDIPVDHVYGQPVILDYLASKTICSNDLVVVSPDVGGVARARYKNYQMHL
ncbi:hypothetical protein ZWY2020_011293 [Hordeum vulgare]|nr:hypothetical protein ZWY2020_011293 [Hordeum vulgare]